jgi:hypothetical protein
MFSHTIHAFRFEDHVTEMTVPGTEAKNRAHKFRHFLIDAFSAFLRRSTLAAKMMHMARRDTTQGTIRRG